uniref:Uncharacterized protein n=1 Tax=Neolamprologus brichardi TaxID=32507 RepID=A0A3Q4GQK3_NEOBR
GHARCILWLRCCCCFPVREKVFLLEACSCDGYTNITQSWRNRGFDAGYFGTTLVNDQQLLNKWWRFTGIGGDRVIINCVSHYRGGTWGSLFISSPYPTTESLTPTTVTAYGFYYQCTDRSAVVNIALCPGGFYVYQPMSYPYSQQGYATCERGAHDGAGSSGSL